MNGDEQYNILMGLKMELDEAIQGWTFSVYQRRDFCGSLWYIDCYCRFPEGFEKFQTIMNIEIHIRNGQIMPYEIDLADPKCFQKVIRCVQKDYRNKLYEMEKKAQDISTMAHSKRMKLEQEMKNERT